MNSGKSTTVVTLLLLIPLAISVLNLVYMGIQTRNPSDLYSTESLGAYFTQQLIQGQPFYQDFHRPPYNIMPYPPLFFWITGLITQLLGLRLQGIFLVGRSLSILCTVMIAYPLYR